MVSIPDVNIRAPLHYFDQGDETTVAGCCSCKHVYVLHATYKDTTDDSSVYYQNDQLTAAEPRLFPTVSA